MIHIFIVSMTSGGVLFSMLAQKANLTPTETWASPELVTSCWQDASGYSSSPAVMSSDSAACVFSLSDSVVTILEFEVITNNSGFTSAASGSVNVCWRERNDCYDSSPWSAVRNTPAADSRQRLRETVGKLHNTLVSVWTFSLIWKSCNKLWMW